MLKDYAVGQTFIDFLAVKRANIGTTTKGSTYLNCTLYDGETEMPAKQWDFVGAPPKENSVIKVEATVEQYQGNPQLIILRWRPSEPKDGVDPKKFIPVSPLSRESAEFQIKNYVNMINHPGIKQMVNACLQGYWDDFFTAPGAVNHHHNYLGGLAEHTIGVVEQALKIAPEDANKDLLIAGALLHDLGKIWEYDWKSGCTIAMTSKGRLIGHIGLELMMLAELILELDNETANQLLHLIASHHGKLEWGSPVEPKTKEAVILHNADILDVQLWKIARAESEAGDSEWTQKVSGLNREFYVPRKIQIASDVLSTAGR